MQGLVPQNLTTLGKVVVEDFVVVALVCFLKANSTMKLNVNQILNKV